MKRSGPPRPQSTQLVRLRRSLRSGPKSAARCPSGALPMLSRKASPCPPSTSPTDVLPYRGRELLNICMRRLGGKFARECRLVPVPDELEALHRRHDRLALAPFPLNLHMLITLP